MPGGYPEYPDPIRDVFKAWSWRVAARARFFGCLVLYLGAGFAMGLRSGRRGTRALPHAQQWAEVFTMAREGCAVAAYKLGIASKPSRG